MTEIMDITNDISHREALEEIEKLWNAPPNTAEGERLEFLMKIVDLYERERWPS